MVLLHILGCGTPTPTPARFGTSCALELDGRTVMVDCGPATTHKLVKAGLWPTAVTELFFTHHHFDHNADYPCFLLCRWDQSTGSQPALRVFGPQPTARITERLIGAGGAFEVDWRARVGAPTSQCVHRNRGGSLPRPEPHVEVTDIGPGPVVAWEGCEVTAARAVHVDPWLDSLGYRFDTPGGAIVFAGDTEPCASIAALSAGAHTLVVNCWDHQARMAENGEHTGQTGTLDAAAMATEAGARGLVLTHTGPALCAPGSRERALADIGARYDGEVIFAEELVRIELW